MAAKHIMGGSKRSSRQGGRIKSKTVNKRGKVKVKLKIKGSPEQVKTAVKKMAGMESDGTPATPTFSTEMK